MAYSEQGLLPIRVKHLDYTDLEQDSYDSLDLLGQELEFYDEFKPWRVEAWAADGSPLRVIAYALEIVLCRRVKQFATRAVLFTQGCIRSDGTRGEAELCAGESHRVLWADGTLEPDDPLARPADYSLVEGSASSPEQFNDRWLKARYRR